MRIGMAGCVLEGQGAYRKGRVRIGRAGCISEGQGAFRKDAPQKKRKWRRKKETGKEKTVSEALPSPTAQASEAFLALSELLGCSGK